MNRTLPLTRSALSVESSVPMALLLGYFACYFALWFTLPQFVWSLPGDNLEQLDWSQTPAWGYWKHPPLPSLVLYALTRVFPATIPVTYALGALQVGMMLVAAWLLARQMFDTRTAWISALLISCISFYTTRMHFYNHNTAMLVAAAAAAYCLWRAVESDDRWWWLALGACWGLGLLSKYQMVVAIACNLLYLATRRSAPLMVRLRGATLAGAVCAALFAPHFVWLVQNDFPTLHYASRFVGADLTFVGRLGRIASFTGDQLLRMFSVGLVMLLATSIDRSKLPHPVPAGNDTRAAEIKRFLAIHAWGPIVFMCLMSLLLGSDLEMHWGTAFLWAVPLWALTTARGRALANARLGLIIALVAVAQVAMAVTGAFSGTDYRRGIRAGSSSSAISRADQMCDRCAQPTVRHGLVQQ